MAYDAKTRILTVEGDEVARVEGLAAHDFTSSAFFIRSFYPMTGPPAEVHLKNITLNGRTVELYTGNFRTCDSGPLTMQVPEDVP